MGRGSVNLQVRLVRATEAYRCPQDNNILIGTCLLNERTALICCSVDQLNERLNKWSQLDNFKMHVLFYRLSV